MTDDNEETDWENYDSGPFCIHWSDPSCDDLCPRCRHACSEHGCGSGTECEADDCTCEGWPKGDDGEWAEPYEPAPSGEGK